MFILGINTYCLFEHEEKMSTCKLYLFVKNICQSVLDWDLIESE